MAKICDNSLYLLNTVIVMIAVSNPNPNNSTDTELAATEQEDHNELTLKRYTKRLNALIDFVEKQCFCDKVAAEIQAVVQIQAGKLKMAMIKAVDNSGLDFSATESDFDQVVLEDPAVQLWANAIESMISVVRKKETNSRWSLQSIRSQFS